MSWNGWRGRAGPYLIAEIGGNHEGDFARALELTRLACDSGVDCVKFQVYTGDTLVSPVESPERHAHFQGFELTRQQYERLAEECRDRGVAFSASVWDPSAIEWIDLLVPFYKVGSGDLTAYPLLDRIAATGKPIVLSTGLATLEEVAETVARLRSRDPRYGADRFLALLQCTAMYPIPDEEANLTVMELFRREFSATVGYSDHTRGTLALEVAVAMGAEILEFHFTDRREGRTFRDHQVSLTPEETEGLALQVTRIRSLQGDGGKRPLTSEVESGHISSFRRAVYPVRDLERGDVLSEKNLCVLRPAYGIDARDWCQLVGRKLKRPVRAFSRLNWDDLDL